MLGEQAENAAQSSQGIYHTMPSKRGPGTWSSAGPIISVSTFSPRSVACGRSPGCGGERRVGRPPSAGHPVEVSGDKVVSGKGLVVGRVFGPSKGGRATDLPAVPFSSRAKLLLVHRIHRL